MWDTSEFLKDAIKIEKCLSEYAKMIIMEMTQIIHLEMEMKEYSQPKT